MKRCTTILIMCVAFLAACNTPRKACRKAERLIARAVWKCPEVLAHDSATVTIRPDSATFQAQPPQVDLDSLLAACAELNAALLAERTAPRPKLATANPAPRQQVTKAVANIQRSACDWPSFVERFGNITVEVKNQGGIPLLVLTDPGETFKVPCPPMVNRPVITGVAQWYRSYFWVTIGFIIIGIGVFIGTHHAGP